MKILYAASEANPFAKSGGLADVAGALPKALVKDGVDARVIMPLYVPVERSPVAISPTSTVSGNIIHGIICAPPKPKPIKSAMMGIRIGGVQDGSIIANIMPPKM